MKIVADLLKKTWLALGIVIILLLCVETVATLVVHSKKMLFKQVVRANLYHLYLGISSTNDYSGEFLRVAPQWSPYLYYKPRPLHGKYINIDENGLRYTLNPCSKGNHPVIIFMFGGSTLWGLGARDAYTIPSILARRICESTGFPVKIFNFGQTAYVSTQELIALILELQHRNVPDIVIFFDGWNDVFSTFQGLPAGSPENEFNRVREFNLSHQCRKLLRESLVLLVKRSNTFKIFSKPRKFWWTPPSKNNINHIAKDVAKIYGANIKLAEALGKEKGFEVMAYLQPTLDFKTSLSSYEKTQFQEWIALHNLLVASYRDIRHFPELAFDPHFHDLSKVFVHMSNSVFIDPVHITEHGNEKVADLIYSDLVPMVKARIRNGH